MAEYMAEKYGIIYDRNGICWIAGVEAIKLPHVLLAFASQWGFLQCRSTEINGFHLEGSLMAGMGERSARQDATTI